MTALPRSFIRIEGVGHHLPDTIVSSADLDRELGQPSGWTEAHTGVRQRHWANPATDSNARMGAAALRAALQDAGRSVRELSLIVNASGTPQQLIPDTAALIQREFGQEASGIPSFSVHSTCLSFMTALHTAVSLTRGPYERIGIVSAEFGSVALNFAQVESAALIGDGAASMIVSRGTPEDTEVLAARFETHGGYAELTQVAGGGTARPASQYTPERHREYTFDMDGPQLLRQALRHLPPLVTATLTQAGLTPDDVDVIIPHQASGNGLKLVERLGFRRDRIAVTLPEVGNVIAASIPLTWSCAHRHGRLQKGKTVLLLGTGAGLSTGAVLLRL